jgi:hypothetical protein
MLTPQERSERARTAAHAMWAKLHQQLRDPEPAATREHLLAAERARRRLAVLRARRALADAERAAAEAVLATEVAEAGG